jgi:hypothetical protein
VADPTAPGAFHLGQLEAFSLLAAPASGPSPIPSKIQKKKKKNHPQLWPFTEPWAPTFWRMKQQ